MRFVKLLKTAIPVALAYAAVKAWNKYQRSISKYPQEVKFHKISTPEYLRMATNSGRKFYIKPYSFGIEKSSDRISQLPMEEGTEFDGKELRVTRIDYEYEPYRN